MKARILICFNSSQDLQIIPAADTLCAGSGLLFRDSGSTYQTGTRETPHEIVCDMIMR